VSGRLAFDAPGGPAAFLYAHIAVLPPRLDEVAKDVPPTLVDLVARCLEKSPDARPSASELAARLGAIADAARARSAIEIAADTSQSATRATSGEAETKLSLRAG
jgi:serine/threonine protein kinase